MNGVNYKRKNQFALTLFFIMLTFMLMFRHESVGSDTANYKYYFLRFANMDWSQIFADNLEVGYAVYNKLLSYISTNVQCFFAITAIITIAMIYPTYKRLCDDASLTVVLFCVMSTFVMLFSGIRQCITIGLGMIAYECVRKKKKLLFVLIVAIAMTFHISSFMLLLLYPIYHLKINKKTIYICAPIIVVIFVLNKQIFSFLTAILMRFTKYDGTMTQTGAYAMLILFALFAVFSFVIPDEEKLDSETVGLRNILLLSLVIQIFAPLHYLAMRMNYYFIIFIPLLIPKIISARSKKYAQVAVVSRHLMVALFWVYFFLILVPSGALKVFPYHFFWENVI